MTTREPKRSCMVGRMAVIAMAVFLVSGIPFTVARSAEDAVSCLSATGEAAVAPCRRELLRDPGNVEIRFALSDAFMGLRRYADAVAVLREGLENFPGNDAIKKKLILAESYLEEQQYIEKQKKNAAAASGSKNQGTQIRLSIIRCKKLKGDTALAACNEGLDMNPDHPDLLTGRGNVWLAKDRFGNAIRDYEAALAADPKNREATKNLRLAQTKREVKITQCLRSDGPDGLKACDAALLTGVPDEFDVQKRRAGLLQAMGREKEAIEAYRAAARLNPDDSQINQSLAALSPVIETPMTVQAPEPSPVPGQATVASTVKPPVQSPPAKAAVAASEMPVQSPPAKAFDPPKVKKAVPEPATASPPIKMAAMQPRQYSNAPEVPGITH